MGGNGMGSIAKKAMFWNNKENRVLISILTKKITIKGASPWPLSSLPDLEIHDLVHKTVKGNITEEC